MHTLHNESYKYVIIDVPLYYKYLWEVYLTIRTQKEIKHIFQNKVENILSLLVFYLIAIERQLAPGD